MSWIRERSFHCPLKEVTMRRFFIIGSFSKSSSSDKARDVDAPRSVHPASNVSKPADVNPPMVRTVKGERPFQLLFPRI
jgi:hypothetical protein